MPLSYSKLDLIYVKVVIFTSKCRPLRYNGDSMGTWRNLGDRAKLASFLTSLEPSGLFYKLVEKPLISRPMTQACFSRIIRGRHNGLFPYLDFVSKFLIAPPSLHVPTTNQAVPSPPRTATPSGTSINYNSL
ncbi:hypothetical protein TNCV_4842041 [Trichonephila clavipes]|uniref:Uncharacterized protein n=1 Tax=Trichonephila clavipes TaxID=2585209 RepID=A0A8X6WIS4_TRICX|nr:hypothetical protein TNCV_4842041 [Trichonephila clavipes]